MTNANIDEYAAARQNIFFTANGETPADGDLTGQCVTLLKWFFQDMCDGFPSPFAARGDARYVGKRLVAQGLAIEVAYADRRPGDVICYEFGTYGHIAGQLSGGRVFEQNVGWSGVASRIVGGSYVYASRIGSENEQWRSDKNPHIYRLKSYNGGGDEMKVDANNLRYLYLGIYAESKTNAQLAADPWIGQDYATCAQALLDYANKNGVAYWQYQPKAEKTIADLKKQLADSTATYEPVTVYRKIS